MEVVGVVLGGLGFVAVWLVLEMLGSAAATGIGTSIQGTVTAKQQLFLERLRREHPDAVVFPARLEGGLGTARGFRLIVADSTGITAFHTPEREAWMVPWADVRSLSERFDAIRLDAGSGTPRLLVPTSAVDELTARTLIRPLIERMLDKRPARHAPT